MFVILRATVEPVQRRARRAAIYVVAESLARRTVYAEATGAQARRLRYHSPIGDGGSSFA